MLLAAASWLTLTVHDAIPKARELATAEFATLRLRLLKIAARIVETTSCIRSRSPRHVPKPISLAACQARCCHSTGGLCAPVRPTIPQARCKVPVVRW